MTPRKSPYDFAGSQAAMYHGQIIEVTTEAVPNGLAGALKVAT